MINALYGKILKGAFFFVGASVGGAVKEVNQSHLELEFNGAFCVRNETKQHLCHSPT